jgi:hypothetical protein
MDEEECGFDCLGADEDMGAGWAANAASELGFDYMSLLKGAGGLMSGAGGMFGGGGGGAGGGDSAAVAAEKARAEAAQRQAESSKRTWMIIGGLALAVLAIGGIAIAARPSRPMLVA